MLHELGLSAEEFRMKGLLSAWGQYFPSAGGSALFISQFGLRREHNLMSRFFHVSQTHHDCSTEFCSDDQNCPVGLVQAIVLVFSPLSCFVSVPAGGYELSRLLERKEE